MEKLVSTRTKRRLEVVFIYSVTTLLMLFFIFPAFHFAITSFKPIKYTYTVVPYELTLSNYQELFAMSPEEFLLPLLNSLFVSTAAMAITVVVCVFGAYSIARFQYRGREDIAFFILALYMFPPIVTLIPLWDMAQAFGLLDNSLFLILCYAFFGIPLSLWLLRGFFIGIPPDIEEAALIDGCSRFSAFVKVTVALIKPGIAVASIFAFIMNWNEYLFASVLTRVAAKTLPVAIAAKGTWLMIEWGPISAMGSLAVVPVLALSFLIQRHIVTGLTLGAVKG